MGDGWCGRPTKPSDGEGPFRVLLGAPWKCHDALALCAGLTGVSAQLCADERGAPGAAAVLQRGAFAEWQGQRRLCGSPFLYQCPRGVPGACISLGHSPAQSGALVWVHACANGAAKAGCASRPSAALGEPPLSDAFDAVNFELAVDLLTVMAGHAREVGACEVPGRPDADRLTARQKRLVRELCGAVHARGEELDLRLGDFAAENSVSVAYLCTLFARGVGVPFRSYLQAWRLHKVRNWLLEDRLTIKEIAARAGYSEPNRLRLAFKGATGLSPRVWREKMLQM